VNCAEYEEWVAADVDERSDAGAARDHRRGCPRCTALWQAHGAWRERLRSPALRQEAPPGLRTRIGALLDEAAAALTRSFGWPRRLAWASVASLALASLVLTFVGRGPSGDPVLAAYRLALDGSLPLSLTTTETAELEAFYRDHHGDDFPAHVVDLSGKGFRLVGGGVRPAGDRLARLSVYGDGVTRIVCDYQAASAYQGRLPAPGEKLFFHDSGLSFCVTRMGEEICVLVTRLPLDRFRALLRA